METVDDQKLGFRILCNKKSVLNNRGLAPFKASSSTLVGSRMLGIVRGVTGMVTIQYQKVGAVSGGL